MLETIFWVAVFMFAGILALMLAAVITMMLEMSD
jgi:hypothetical protein